MGRSLRTDADGAWHHVMNRGAGRRIVFRCDLEREVFVARLAEFEERFGVEVHCYCLMGNHYHLLVRSTEGRLSEAMGWLGSRFTRHVNEVRAVDGAIFRGRFHSVHVKRDAHLVWLYRYINANPRDLGWSGALGEYPWSGLGATLGRVDNGWMRHDFLRGRFGDDLRALERFVDRDATNDACVVPDRCADADIALAAEVARAPGPDVNTAAEVRAAHSVVAVRASIDRSLISTIAGLSGEAPDRYLLRATRRAHTDVSIRELVARIESILAIGHLVPDTQ